MQSLDFTSQLITIFFKRKVQNYNFLFSSYSGAVWLQRCPYCEKSYEEMSKRASMQSSVSIIFTISLAEKERPRLTTAAISALYLPVCLSAFVNLLFL